MKKIIFYLFLIQAISYSQWYQLNSSTSNSFFSCSFINPNTGWVSGYLGQVFMTTNGGNNWNMIFDSQSSDRFDCMTFKSNLNGWVGSYLGKVYKTTNGGCNWTYQIILINNRILDIYFVDLNNGFIVGQSGISHKTTDGGISWHSMNINIYLNCVYFLNTSTGFVGGNSYFSRSTDGGNNWSQLTIPSDEIVESISFINISTGWAICRKLNNLNSSSALSVLKTTNSGSNWSEICAESNNYGFHTIVNDAFFIDNNIGYYCGYFGYAPPPSNQYGIFYKTTNGGINWVNINVAGTYSYEALKFANSQTGYLVGYNGIIFKTTNGGNVLINSQKSNIPTNFSLSQNYPNPFNPNSKIKFQIAKLGDVQLKIYDILGCEVATLVNEKLQPGTYEVEFDGTNYPSGVYFYKLETESFSNTKRMVIIK